MFDWDDQELANIIWGEGTEADDQIVQYPEDTGKKDLPNYRDKDKKNLTEGNTNRKIAEESTANKSFPDGGKQESNSGASSVQASMGAQHDLPTFSASKTDGNSIAKKTQLDIGLEISQNQDEDKELGELVGNSWANIGGFDDLDRIFSNDDLDGQTSLGSRDELWSASKDLMSGASKSSSQAMGSTSWEFDAMGNTASHFEINSEYLLDENYSALPGSRKRVAISSYSQQNFGECVQQEEYAVDTSSSIRKKVALRMSAKTTSDSRITAEETGTSNASAAKENWSSNQSKHFQQMDKLSGSRRLGDMYDSCPSNAASVPQFDSQCTPATVQNYPILVHRQQQLPRGSRSMAYQHLSNPSIGTCAYGDFTHQYPATRMLKPTAMEHQSNSEACIGNVMSLNQPMETSPTPINMTPQEKIEKLRKRQQMRAMLAIQLQQQQLGQQGSNVDYAVPQKSCQEDQVLNVEKADFEADEHLSTLPCYDLGSPDKKEDSSTISNSDDYSEDTIFYQLQDIIARMDLSIRLCIRDSLYRLAQNAMQRSYTSDTSSTHRSIHEQNAAKKETSSHNRFSRKVRVENDTNHIDRIVAHLLFHRPFKLSSKHGDTPESFTSTKVSTEQKTGGPNSVEVSFLTKSSENEYNLSPHDSRTSCPFVDSCEEDILSNIPQREMSRKTEHL